MIVHKETNTIYIRWNSKYYKLTDYHRTLKIPNTEYSYSHYTSLPLFAQLNDMIEDVLLFGNFCTIVLVESDFMKIDIGNRFIFACEEIEEALLVEIVI